MKKTLFIAIAGLAIMLSGSAFIIKNAGGKAGQAGSPGEGTCADCHSGGSSIVSGATITAIPGFTAGQYVPGNTYTVNVLVGALSFTSFGFGCEILNSSNANAGTMQNAGAGVQFVNAGNGRKNATHTAPKAGTSLATFSFEWVAPASGAVTIYAAGNCVNGTGSTLGDLPVSATLSLTAQTATNTSVSENSKEVNGFKFFPNPAVDNISVYYNLVESGDVNVELVGINGKLVSVLLNEKQQAGAINKNLNIPSSVASGVYFLRVNHNGKNISQKLITVN
ncbi:MAG: choice-of-anchor V domain-containing protein [Sphingobacteriaceae bacterium]